MAGDVAAQSLEFGEGNPQGTARPGDAALFVVALLAAIAVVALLNHRKG